MERKKPVEPDGSGTRLVGVFLVGQTQVLGCCTGTGHQVSLVRRVRAGQPGRPLLTTGVGIKGEVGVWEHSHTTWNRVWGLSQNIQRG